MSNQSEQINELAKMLAEPFPIDDIEWRIGACGENNGKIWGTALAYISARACQDRLDEVFGIMGWHAMYERSTDGVMCKIGVRLNSSDPFLYKEDGAEHTDMEPFKGGISGAFKRAACVWRIGRYLYKLEDNFATILDAKRPGAYKGKTKENKYFFWLPPELPKWALPVPAAPKPLAPGLPTPRQSNVSQPSGTSGQFQAQFDRLGNNLVK